MSNDFLFIFLTWPKSHNVKRENSFLISISLCFILAFFSGQSSFVVIIFFRKWTFWFLQNFLVVYSLIFSTNDYQSQTETFLFWLQLCLYMEISLSCIQYSTTHWASHLNELKCCGWKKFFFFCYCCCGCATLLTDSIAVCDFYNCHSVFILHKYFFFFCACSNEVSPMICSFCKFLILYYFMPISHS